jgi:hypothetical protein
MIQCTVIDNCNHTLTLRTDAVYALGSTVYITDNLVEEHAQLRLHILVSTVQELEEQFDKTNKKHIIELEKKDSLISTLEKQIIEMQKK